jgi:hypothetical protein
MLSKKCILCWHQNLQVYHQSLRSLMKKHTQFKVALKRYLNTHSFYSVEEFLTFRNNSLYMKNFSPYCFVVWTLHNVYTLYQTLFVILCCLVPGSFLFCSFCIYLYVMYLYDLFHIPSLPLQTYESMEFIYLFNWFMYISSALSKG